MENSKACSKCGQVKQLSCFSRHNGSKSSKSGYRASCKSCDVEYNRRYRQANRDAVNRRKREWAAANPQKKAAMDATYRQKNKDKIRANFLIWAEKNKERLKEKNREYRLANADAKKEKDRLYAKAHPEVNAAASRRYRKNNPEKVKEIQKKYQSKNPEIRVNIRAKRRARINSGKYLVTNREIKLLRKMQCLYCGLPGGQIDHVIPIARGGEHRIGNLAPACRSCNAQKNRSFIMEWRKRKLKDFDNKKNN